MNILNLNTELKASAEEFRNRYLFLDKMFVDREYKSR